MAKEYPDMPAAPESAAPVEDEELDFMDEGEEGAEEEAPEAADLTKASDDELIDEVIKRGLADEVEEEVEEKGDAAEEVSDEAPAPDKKYSNEGASFENPFDIAK